MYTVLRHCTLYCVSALYVILCYGTVLYNVLRQGSEILCYRTVLKYCVTAPYWNSVLWHFTEILCYGTLLECVSALYCILRHGTVLYTLSRHSTEYCVTALY